MKFEVPLLKGRLVRRYKRFLADVILSDGNETTVHCPNTGSMLGCNEPGSTVWLLQVDNPNRKYPLGWELVEVSQSVLVGINTSRSNSLVAEALENRIISQLADFNVVRREVKIPNTRSRIDFLLSGHQTEPDCYLEVKNVTAALDNGQGFFPDAVSDRATRHVEELAHRVEDGQRGALCYCVQRADVEYVTPADEIDPEYGKALRRAVEVGVEVYALGATVTPEAVILDKNIPVKLDV
ncbi:MAG: DNA/RNA nuclease SfsA [Rhodospirillaceae bacterium]|nr:DNA/RNA nuclease SfsA [Rhodospirillaceae bacterium]|tara:strand:+ start:8966 stop:9682 length:717 start_codon:yes stop_codon:yes gene_type:complete